MPRAAKREDGLWAATKAERRRSRTETIRTLAHTRRGSDKPRNGASPRDPSPPFRMPRAGKSRGWARSGSESRMASIPGQVHPNSVSLAWASKCKGRSQAKALLSIHSILHSVQDDHQHCSGKPKDGKGNPRPLPNFGNLRDGAVGQESAPPTDIKSAERGGPTGCPEPRPRETCLVGSLPSPNHAFRRIPNLDSLGIELLPNRI